MTQGLLDRRVEATRRFTRFYTQRMGVLDRHLLDSPYSLSEARVLYEVAHREDATAAELSAELKLDPGYMSRILAKFERLGLVEKRHSQSDGRSRHLRLTLEGEDAFATLNARSRHRTAAMLRALSPAERQDLTEAMATIETLLKAQAPRRAPFILRPHRPGDMGWIVRRHAELYTAEYGWDESFEALVAEIAARFLRSFDPARERCWIAERHGGNVGSAMLAKDDERTARIRLVLVEPGARGLGIGQRLVGECLAFARGAGYRRVTLWTNDVLHAARRLYQRAGFRLVEENPHRSFGQDLIGQTWTLDL